MKEISDSRSTRLAVVASYASLGQIEVAGNASALLEFAAVLAAAEPLTERFLMVPSDRTASPYDHFLQKMRVEKNEEKVLITKEEDTLKISGSTQNLSQLAENIRWLASREDAPRLSDTLRDHLHIEYYPDHFYLAPCADALIVVKEDS